MFKLWKQPTLMLMLGLVLAGVSLCPPQAEALKLTTKVGLASYYGPKFHGKCCTASGERVNMYLLTAAHRTLPFGTRVRVTNVENKRSVIVRINDRGPFHGNRIIDLSKGAFDRIALKNSGVVKVRLELLNRYSDSLDQGKFTSIPVMWVPAAEQVHSPVLGAQ